MFNELVFVIFCIYVIGALNRLERNLEGIRDEINKKLEEINKKQVEASKIQIMIMESQIGLYGLSESISGILSTMDKLKNHNF